MFNSSIKTPSINISNALESTSLKILALHPPNKVTESVPIESGCRAIFHRTDNIGTLLPPPDFLSIEESKSIPRFAGLNFLFSLFIFLPQFLFSQSLTPTVISSQGDYFTSAGGSLSWTLGEIMGETYPSASNFLTQGFQQPKLLVTSVTDNEQENTLGLFPNPTSGIFTVILSGVEGQSPGKISSIQIINILGEKIFPKQLTTINGQLTTIDLSHLANGMYQVVIARENNFQRTYKIIKSE